MTTDAPSPGEKFGRYRIEAKLGVGGMGAVFAAWDEVLHRPVALKLLHGDDRDLLVSEARAIAALDHPNVVRVYSLEHENGRIFAVMELVRGRSVDMLLSESGKLPPATAVQIVRAVSVALTAIHRAGLVHGDLKPSNILVEEPSGRIVITDFGLARSSHAQSFSGSFVRGTPAYLCPEAARAIPVSSDMRTRQDVYALAMTAYELLSGAPPFDDQDPEQVLWDQVHSEVPRIDLRERSLSWRVDAALRAALAKKPSDRTPTPACFAADLSRAVKRGFEPARVLLVDDDDEYRQFVTLALIRRLGMVVVQAASDGEVGYHAAACSRPDLAIVDLAMPGLNGLELTAALRATSGFETLPIVVLSGAMTQKERELLAKLGATLCLEKPIAPWQLAEATRFVLGFPPEKRSGSVLRVDADTRIEPAKRAQ
jgi:eukaryotic-like serine/threonine-protein kinase